MVGQLHQQRGQGRRTLPRDLTVCWANTGKGQGHDILLSMAHEQDIDVICVQEPWTGKETRTKTHPGYQMYTPVDSWNTTSDRPRVLTYVRRGTPLKVQQRRPLQCRDLLWLDVNGFAILNIYRQPLTNEVIDYVTTLTPPRKCLIGGDFNARHDTFEPGSEPFARGADLAEWSARSGMDYIGEPGVPTQDHGHVLDLTFSNIPGAYTTVYTELSCGSDHRSQVTLIPGRGKVPLEQVRYRVPESQLPKLASLVHNGISMLPDPWGITSTNQIDATAEAVSTIFHTAIEAAGKPSRDTAKAAPWWTDECKSARYDHLQSISTGRFGNSEGATEETRHFHRVARKAKAEYWKKILNSVRDDKSLYKVVAWHKKGPSIKAPPLVINGRVVEDTLEKAEGLRTEVLDRFDASDDLPEDPLQQWAGTAELPWSNTVTIEEVERHTIGVSSTSPGTDGVTVRHLKACWEYLKGPIHALFSACLAFNHFPCSWKYAEVAMLPKAGKKNKESPRSWRPIALLSCISKGLERIIANRISWTALLHGVLSPQHGGALPKRSAMDLVACFTHDAESYLAKGWEVTLVTMDVQGAFDALLVRRLLKRMMEQGWPYNLICLCRSFLSDRKVRVRLESATTEYYTVNCGTPQGSPLSPVLYMLYLAELLKMDQRLRFGYADDIALYRASPSVHTNVELLAKDVGKIIEWGNTNKVFFAPEKLEMIHLTNKRHGESPSCEVSPELTIEPITEPEKNGGIPALRWLGVWFDRRLKFKRHVQERAAKARGVAYHLRNLANTKNGPPASALRKAVITCVVPSLLFGTEAWYGGRRKRPAENRQDRDTSVSTKLGEHIKVVEKALTIALRGVLPTWRTTPNVALFRDAAVPAAEAVLEEAKLRFAMRLQTVDENHPLVQRIQLSKIARGKHAGRQQVPRTKIQRLGEIIPAALRPVLRMPHYSHGCRINPTYGRTKEEAAKGFKKWWAKLPSDVVTVFSDGSEQYDQGTKYVGYGYAVYQNGVQLHTGYGSINSTSHVFDAEAIGAWKGLQRTLRDPTLRYRKIVQCIDSTSVIWCLRGNASTSSQWAFHQCQDAMAIHDISIRWSPGHTGIEGNEAADGLANQGARKPQWDKGPSSQPTISGIRSIYRELRNHALAEWWETQETTLSLHYRYWALPYNTRPSKELDLPRSTLQRLLAARTSHGDFAWYHRKYKHPDANIRCSCRKLKTPEHLVMCRKAQKLYKHWPVKPDVPIGRDKKDARAYLRILLQNPQHFVEYLNLTEFYSKICPRG
jgi:ribonuclease HI